MDEITRALLIARFHFNDSPVLNSWYLKWSSEYRLRGYQDHLAWALRKGRQVDSRLLTRESCLPLRAWHFQFMLRNTSVVWQR